MRLAATVLTVWINVGIALQVIAYGLRASPNDIWFLLRQRRLLVLSLVSVFIVTPAIALGVVQAIPMSRVAKVAIVALSFSIIPPTLPRRLLATGGNRAYASGLTVIVAVSAIVLVPVLVDVLGTVTHRPYGVPADQLAGYIVTILGLPLAFGLCVRKLRPGLAGRVNVPLSRAAIITSTSVLVVQLVITFPQVVRLAESRTVIGIVVFNLAALAAGHLLGGPEPDRALTLALSSASRHPAIALTIATANYPGERFLSTVILCLIINALVCTPYSRWQLRQRSRNPAASADGG